MKRNILIIFSIFTFTFNVKAQDGLEGILQASIEDAGKITRHISIRL